MSVLEDLFGGIKSLGELAPTAKAWKELVDPVRAVSQPTFGTATGTPIINPPPGGNVSKTPGQNPPASMTVWIAVGGLAIVLLFLIMSRKG